MATKQHILEELLQALAVFTADYTEEELRELLAGLLKIAEKSRPKHG